MTDPRKPSLDPLGIAISQRRMLVCFAVAIILPVVTLAIASLVAPETETPEVISSSVRITGFVQIVATIAYMVAGFRLIREIGWSAGNQLAFIFICLISMGCGLLLFLALFFINAEANRILRSHDVKVGLLGVSKPEMDRLSAIGRD